MAHTLTPRRWLVLIAVALCASLGDTCLTLGMRHVGAVSLHQWWTLVFALKQPWVLLGIALLLGFFGCYLTAISWADLTFVLPATSFGYIVMALMGRFVLHEHVSPARWLGVVLITIGIGFVATGPSLTEADKQPGVAL